MEGRPALSAAMTDLVSSLRARIGAVLAHAGIAPDARLLVGFSGGLDSSVLLDALSAIRAPDAVHAGHVDHGLVSGSAAWAAHCADFASERRVGFDALRLSPPPARVDSLEAWARERRYRALWQLARERGCAALCVAHHLGDQAETLLFRLARGTGIEGLTGMRAAVIRPQGLLLRPMLAVSRQAILAYGRERRLDWIDDPTNREQRFTRNALRARVLPALEELMPGATERIAWAAGRVAAAVDTLDEMARRDLDQARGPQTGSLDRATLAGLDDDRCARMLRLWLRERGMGAPSAAKTAEMRRQLVDSGHADGRVEHDGWVLYRYREQIAAIPAPRFRLASTRVATLPLTAAPAAIAGGCLRWVAAQAGGAPGGLDPGWLAAQPLRVGVAAFGSRLRIRPDAGTRSLKNLFQQRGIPDWMRPALPAVFVAERLLYVAGLGMDHSAHWPWASGGWMPVWHPDSPDDPRAAFLPVEPRADREANAPCV